jgi:hypothetical protein
LVMHRSVLGLRLGWAVAALVISVLPSQAQDNTDKNAPLPVPHTASPVLSNCDSDISASWKKVPRISLSKESGTVMRIDAKRPLALEFLRSDPSAAVTAVPANIKGKLGSFNEQYGFQWDENRLYGYVELSEQDVDSRHPKISEKTFRRSPYEAAFDDLFYSSVVVEVGAPSWHRWITEMHVHVRPPNSKPMTSMFFGRTNNEDQFRELAGEAIACPANGGWIAKFAVAWLPFADWHPASGVTANLKLVAPLAHSHEGYVLVRVVPFVLTTEPAKAPMPAPGHVP